MMRLLLRSLILPALCAGALNSWAQTYTASTVLGNGTVTLKSPQSVSVDTSGNVYIADTGDALALKVNSAGVVSTLAGGVSNNLLKSPTGIVADNAQTVYVADSGAALVKQVTPTGVTSAYAGNGIPGYSGDGAPAITAQVSSNLQQLAIDRRGSLYIADTGNNRVRRVALDGTITTFAGNGAQFTQGDGGPATGAGMTPTAVAVDTAGNVYIADNFAVRKVDAVTGLISTVAGGVNPGYSGDGNPATAASFRNITGLAVDSSGNLFVADRGNHVVRRISAAGIVTTIAGNGSTTFNTDAGVALSVAMDPVQVAADNLGNVFVADAANNRIRKLTPVVGLQIFPNGVVGAGLSATAVHALSPGGIATIFGNNFFPAGTNRVLTAADISGGKLPQNLGNVCVQVGPTRAFLYAVYPGQINFQTPALPDGNYALSVITNCGQVGETVSNSISVTVQAATPEFFYFTAGTGGHSPIAAVDASTGIDVGAPGLLPGATFAGARPGDVITLYATGLGAAGTPATAPGVLANGLNSVTAGIRLTIGGVDVPFSNITYVGLAPTYAGLYQINFVLPVGTPTGDQPVTITIGGASGATSPVGYLRVGN